MLFSLILCDQMDSNTLDFPVHLPLRVCSNSCPLSLWFYLTISSIVIYHPLLCCFQSFPASGFFPSGSILHQVLSHAVWGHPRRRVMVERSDRMWSTGEGNGKPVQYSCLENPVNSVSRHGSPAHNFSPHVPTVWRARSHCPAWLSQLSVKSRVSSGCKERTTLQHTCTSSDKGQGKYVAQ